MFFSSNGYDQVVTPVYRPQQIVTKGEQWEFVEPEDPKVRATLTSPLVHPPGSPIPMWGIYGAPSSAIPEDHPMWSGGTAEARFKQKDPGFINKVVQKPTEVWRELDACNGPYSERGKYMVDYTKHLVAAHQYEQEARTYELEHSNPPTRVLQTFKEEYISELAERSRKAQEFAQQEHIWIVIQWGERHNPVFSGRIPPSHHGARRPPLMDLTPWNEDDWRRHTNDIYQETWQTVNPSRSQQWGPVREEAVRTVQWANPFAPNKGPPPKYTRYVHKMCDKRGGAHDRDWCPKDQRYPNPLRGKK